LTSSFDITVYLGFKELTFGLKVMAKFSFLNELCH